MTDNFEKDINVPSKRRIMDDYNAKDCEQCSSDSVCCYCKNIAYYKLEEQIKAKEQECESWKALIDEAQIEQRKLEQQLDQLKAENEHLSEKEEEARHYLEEASKYKQILAEIREIVKTCNSGVICSECPYTEQCRTDIEAEALGICNLILQKFEGLNE